MKLSNCLIFVEKINKYSLFLQCDFYFTMRQLSKAVINKENIDGLRVSMSISQRTKCLVLQDYCLNFLYA